MKGFNRKALKYSVNESFFDSWTSRMAYVLGFTFADGNIYKTSLSWDVQKMDLNILEKINTALNSNYPISEQRRSSYRLRINNQILIKSATSKGLLPRKFIKHFIRGYLDGDGWIVIREGRNEIDLGFVCGNRSFLEDLSDIITRETGVIGRVREKTKITPKGVRSKTFLMEYYSSKALMVANFLCGNLAVDDLYLDRKHIKYLKAKELHDYLKSGTRKVRIIQKYLGQPLNLVLRDLYINKHLDGVQIAKTLGVHSSSVYRWLAHFGVKYLVHRKMYYG